MKIIVKVKPNSKKSEVIPITQQQLSFPDFKNQPPVFKVEVRAPAHNNLANIACQRILAEYFKINILEVKLLKGKTSKIKVFDVNIK